MVLLHRFALFFVVFITSVVAVADDHPVKLPFVERGDCWSYRAETKSSSSNPPLGDYKVCVTFVDREKNLILAMATFQKDGREADMTYTSEWGTITSASGLMFIPPIRILKFPLRVGENWETDSEFRQPRQGTFAGKAKSTMRVVGWEEITVPAGTFRALKIEGRSSYERYDTKARGISNTAYWYVPEINRYVKYQREEPGLSHVDVLTNYELNK